MGRRPSTTAYWSRRECSDPPTRRAAQAPASRRQRRSADRRSRRGTPAQRPIGGRRRPQAPIPRPPRSPSGCCSSLLSLVALGAVARRHRLRHDQIPQPNELANAQASIVYYADGKTELARLADAQGNRESVPLAKVPEPVQEACSPPRTATSTPNHGISADRHRCAPSWQALQRRRRQGGGSTITQQYVKNYFLTPGPHADRARSRRSSSPSRSTSSSPRTRSSRTTSTRSTTAAAPTASRPRPRPTSTRTSASSPSPRAPSSPPSSTRRRSTTRRSATKQKANLKNRVAYVLDGMVAGGLAERRPTAPRSPGCRRPSRRPSNDRDRRARTATSSTQVRKELGSTLELSESDIDRGGLRITTTIDKKAQDAAVAAMQENLPKEAPDVQAGLTSIKPGDGAIVAMYGGADFQKRQLNSATQAIMQAGSTFKPFALIAAPAAGHQHQDPVQRQQPQIIGRQRQGPEQVRPELRDDRPAPGDRQVGQHGLRRPQQQDRPGETPRTPPSPPASRRRPPVSTTRSPTSSAPPRRTSSTWPPPTATIAAQGQKATPYLVAQVTSETSDIDYKANKQTTAAFGNDVAADTIDALQQSPPPAAPARAPQASAARSPARPAPPTSTSRSGSPASSRSSPSRSACTATSTASPSRLDNIPRPQRQRGRRHSLPLSMWLDFMKVGHPGHGGPAVPQAGRHR